MRRPLSLLTSVLLSASLLGGGALAQTGSGPDRSAPSNPAQVCAPRDGQPRTDARQTCPQTSRTQQPTQPQTQPTPNRTGQVQPQRQSAQAPQARRADVSRVDVYLDGRKVLDNVTREQATRLRVGPGEHRIVVVPHGQPLTGALASRTFRMQKATTVQLSLGDSFSISLR